MINKKDNELINTLIKEIHHIFIRRKDQLDNNPVAIPVGCLVRVILDITIGINEERILDKKIPDKKILNMILTLIDSMYHEYKRALK